MAPIMSNATNATAASAVHSAKSAREELAKGLSALQGDEHVPPQLLELAAPIAQSMGALHQIERSGGAELKPHADVALSNVRAALAQLQAQPPSHPAVARAMEAVASSLSHVHALSKMAAQPAPAPAPAYNPPPQHQQPPVAFAATIAEPRRSTVGERLRRRRVSFPRRPADGNGGAGALRPAAAGGSPVVLAAGRARRAGPAAVAGLPAAAAAASGRRAADAAARVQPGAGAPAGKRAAAGERRSRRAQPDQLLQGPRRQRHHRPRRALRLHVHGAQDRDECTFEGLAARRLRVRGERGGALGRARPPVRARRRRASARSSPRSRPKHASSCIGTCETGSRSSTTICDRGASARLPTPCCCREPPFHASSCSSRSWPCSALRGPARAISWPYLKWHTIETAHFRINYYSGEEEIAQTVARLAEDIHGRLAPAVGWTPKARTEILLTDDSDAANGSATALPYNAIRLYVTAPGRPVPAGRHRPVVPGAGHPRVHAHPPHRSDPRHPGVGERGARQDARAQPDRAALDARGAGRLRGERSHQRRAPALQRVEHVHASRRARGQPGDPGPVLQRRAPLAAGGTSGTCTARSSCAGSRAPTGTTPSAR